MPIDFITITLTPTEDGTFDVNYILNDMFATVTEDGIREISDVLGSAVDDIREIAYKNLRPEQEEEEVNE